MSTSSHNFPCGFCCKNFASKEGFISHCHTTHANTHTTHANTRTACASTAQQPPPLIALDGAPIGGIPPVRQEHSHVFEHSRVFECPECQGHYKYSRIGLTKHKLDKHGVNHGAPIGGAPIGGAPIGGAPIGGTPPKKGLRVFECPECPGHYKYTGHGLITHKSIKHGVNHGAPIGGAPIGGAPIGGAPINETPLIHEIIMDPPVQAPSVQAPPVQSLEPEPAPLDVLSVLERKIIPLMDLIKKNGIEDTNHPLYRMWNYLRSKYEDVLNSLSSSDRILAKASAVEKMENFKKSPWEFKF